MMPKIFLALVGGLLVYELIALSDANEGDTISEIMWKATRHRPLIPFGMGLLMGHFFWQRGRDRDWRQRREAERLRRAGSPAIETPAPATGS